MAKKEKPAESVDQLIAVMNKQFGDNSFGEFGQGRANVEVIPSGIPSLDLASGVGGFPRGRIVELFGPEGGGKTTVALKAMANCQKLAGKMPLMIGGPRSDVKPLTGRVGFIDVEHAFTPSLAQLHGVQMGKGSGFYFSQPDGGDQALRQLEYMVNSNLFDMIVVDSVAGLSSLDEQDKEIGEKVMAGTAQLMSSGLKKLVPLISKSRTVVIFINQIREKVAVMFGSPETTPGGRALKFYASMRMRVSQKESFLDGTTKVGHKMKIDFKKNKVAPPFEVAEIDLYYRAYKDKEAGFDIWTDYIAVASETGVVELKGSSYQFADRTTGEIHKANGKVKWIAYLQERPEVMEAIMNIMLGVDDQDEHNEQSE